METPPCNDPILALAERTALVDGMVERSAGDKLWPAFPAGLTLLAVGGYGRRHLFPYSDVDLLLLVGKRPAGAGSPRVRLGFSADALGFGGCASAIPCARRKNAPRYTIRISS